jgi:hypothetical protein
MASRFVAIVFGAGFQHAPVLRDTQVALNLKAADPERDHRRHLYLQLHYLDLLVTSGLQGSQGFHFFVGGNAKPVRVFESSIICRFCKHLFM